MTWKPKDLRQIPTATGPLEIEVWSLAPHGNGNRLSDLAYLQHIRSGVAKVVSPTGRPEDSLQAGRYFAGLPKFADALTNLVAAELQDVQPDAILELPSTRDFNAPYTSAIQERFPTAVNLTGAISRCGQVKSGQSDSFDDILADTVGNSPLDLSNVKTLVIIDDVFGKGKTVGAAVSRLRELGLPADARVALAVPLVVVGV